MNDTSNFDNLSSESPSRVRDKWAEWLLNKRQGGAENYQDSLRAFFPIRDRVLENACIEQGNVVLDVGCGDGLIGFGALDKVGTKGKVIFSDISQDCLDYCKEGVESIGASKQAEFICCSADNLSGIADESVDVVCTRSVLIYVQDKSRCFEEFFRVLKPGGRVSIFEPINRYSFGRGPQKSYLGVDLRPVEHLLSKLSTSNENERKEKLEQELANNTMLNFDQKDLMDFAFKAGFANVSMNCEVQSSRGKSEMRWELFYLSAPNPRANCLHDDLVGRLSPEELSEFEAIMKAEVDSGVREHHLALVYLKAQK